MLAASDTWRAAMARPDKKLVWTMTLTTGSTTYSFVSGERPLWGLPNTIIAVTPFSSDVDIVTRQTAASSFDVVCHDDGYLRDIVISNHNIKGASVLLKLGEASLESTDVVTQFAGVVSDYRPDEDNTIIIEVKEKVHLFNHLTGIGFIKNRHPLTVLRWFLAAAGVSNVNENSFDPRHVDNSDIGHFTVSRTVTEIENVDMSNVGMAEPEDLAAAFDELLNLLLGTITFDTNGDLEIRRYKVKTSSLHISQSDIIEYRQRATAETLITKVEVPINGTISEDLIDRNVFTGGFPDRKIIRDSAFKYVQVNTAAQNSLGIADDSRLVETTTISTKWLNGLVRDPASTTASPGSGSYSTIHSDQLTAAAPWFRVNAHYPGGICGTKYSVGGMDPGEDLYPIPTQFEVTNARRSYLAVVANDHEGLKFDPTYGVSSDDMSYQTFDPEIIAIKSVIVKDADDNIEGDLHNPADNLVQDWFVLDDDTILFLGPRSEVSPFTQNFVGNDRIPEDIHFEIAERGVDGTFAKRHPNRGAGDTRDVTPTWEQNTRGLVIADVTIAKYVADYLIDRFSYGAPVVEIDVGLEFAHLEVSDFITFTHSKYFRDQVNGSDENTSWEVIGKEIDASEGFVTFTLGWVSDNINRTITRVSYGPSSFPTNEPPSQDTVIDNDSNPVWDGTNFVVEG